MLEYRKASASRDAAAEHRERVSWLSIESFVLEQKVGYLPSNTQLIFISHGIPWFECRYLQYPPCVKRPTWNRRTDFDSVDAFWTPGFVTPGSSRNGLGYVSKLTATTARIRPGCQRL